MRGAWQNSDASRPQHWQREKRRQCKTPQAFLAAETMKKEKGKLDNLLLRQNGQEEATSNGTPQTQGDQAGAASVEGGVHTPSKL